MVNKKYYLISEVAEILNLPIYKLRYIEKVKNDLKIHKVKNRRYYTQADIEKLKTLFSYSNPINAKLDLPKVNVYANDFGIKLTPTSNDSLVYRIEDLIDNLNKMKSEIELYIVN